MDKPYLSIVIPIKNEKENIEPLIDSILRELAPLKRPFEIIFIDDGSNDGSLEVLKSLAGRTPQVRAIQFDRNYGQTAALVAGFRKARGRVIATLDGDCQNDPADIPRMAAKLEKGPWHMVAGYRVKRHDNIIRKASSRIANAVRRWLVKDDLRDTGCALKLFYRDCLRDMPFFEGMHRFMGALFKMQGYRIAQMPVRHHPRTCGRTKYGIGNRLGKSIRDLLAVRWMQRRCLRFKIKKNYPSD
jgi:glycosyltransferase involved in cell wall biosynthesis